MKLDDKTPEREMNSKTFEIWLRLPEDIKNDPIMDNFKIHHEQHPDSYQNLCPNYETDTPSIEISDSKAGFQIEDGNETISKQFFSDSFLEKIRLLSTCSKCIILSLIWLTLSIVLILKDEKSTNFKPTFVPVNQSKYNIIKTERNTDDINKILVELNGPFINENDSNKSNVWIDLWMDAIQFQNDDRIDDNMTGSSQVISSIWRVYMGNSDSLRSLSHVFDITSTNHSGKILSITTKSNHDRIIAMNMNYETKPMNRTLGVIFAAIILVGLYVIIIFEITHRTFAAILSSTSALAALAYLDQRPTMKEVMSWIDEETLLLLFSMMFIVSILSETGIFDYMAVLAYKITHGKIWHLITCLCLFTCILASLLDNVTTILLMTPVAIRLCEVMNVLPIPVLILMVIYSNIGGTLTPIGDPPNVIIASNPHVINSGVNFGLFTMHMGTGLIFVGLFTCAIFRILYKNISALKNHDCKEIKDEKERLSRWKKTLAIFSTLSENCDDIKNAIKNKIDNLEENLEKKINSTQIHFEAYQETLTELNNKYGIKNKQLLIRCSIVITFVITIFFLHSLPQLQRISLGWTAFLGVILLVILTDRQDIDMILSKVEWTTLLFFTSLFILMEALTKLGLIDLIGKQTEYIILSVSENFRLTVAIVIILWISALTSAFVDNIPLTTMMIKIAISLGNNPTLNIPLQPLMWALSFGACLGGNGTLIGASANVVCAGIAEQHGHRISFAAFFKIGFPIMLGSITTVTCYLLICHVLLQWH